MFQQDYFELFGLEQTFELDRDVLMHRYRDLQKATHPDKFANGPEQERRIALQRAGQINSAYQTLKDPLSRAQYLLSLSGVESVLEQTTIRDIEFLEEQMELRETLADIRNDADPQGSIFHFLADLNKREKTYFNQLSKLLSNADEAALIQANDLTLRLQFVRRLQQEAEAVEEDFF